LFSRAAGTTWTQQAILTASDGAARDGFGVSVAVEGNRAVIGADFKAIGAASFAGAAYVFERRGVVWTQAARVTAQPPFAGGQFGLSLDLRGGMLLVADHRRPAHFLFARGMTAGEWNLVDSRVYTGADHLAVSAVAFDRTAGRFLVETMAFEASGRATYIYAPDYGNADGLADYARKFLYAPEASAAEIPFDPNQAAFRYKHQLYGEDAESPGRSVPATN
jgi:hypothetical protein